jgi:hypothetical protein
MMISVLKISAFSDGNIGGNICGNPAGVLIADELPTAAEMQRIAANVLVSRRPRRLPYLLLLVLLLRWRSSLLLEVVGECDTSRPSRKFHFVDMRPSRLVRRWPFKSGDGVYPITHFNGANITEGSKDGEVMTALASVTANPQ